MARWLEPPLLQHHISHRYVHNAINISFTVACIAAMIAIVSALCSSCHKKPKQKTPRKSQPHSNNCSPEIQIPVCNNPEFQSATVQKKAESLVVVELTPDVATHGPILPAMLPSSSSSKSMSMRRLSISLSKKLPDMMQTSRRERKDHNAAEPGGDMIWKKTIILGEKCRVPSDDEEEGGVRNYYPRTPRSRAVSRNNSFANYDATARTSSVEQSDLSVERREEASDKT